MKEIQTWVGFPHLSFIDTDTWILIETSHVVGICQDEAGFQQEEGKTLFWAGFQNWGEAVGALLICCHHGSLGMMLASLRTHLPFSLGMGLKKYTAFCVSSLCQVNGYFTLYIVGAKTCSQEPQLWWRMAT